MRRIMWVAACAAFLLPSAAEAQFPRIMAGGGLSTPTSDFSDDAKVGYHGRVGLQMGVPTSPLAGRLEGEYHAFGESDAGSKTKVLNGALSAVLSLDGVGITPYFLAGIGRYRVDTEVGAVDPDPVTETGFHGGFGVNIGALGFGGFAEFRVVQINTDVYKTRYFPISVGFRL
ncbi:MAG: outer membrane beta-barrel protein [Gemmatimonadota bacterium]